MRLSTFVAIPLSLTLAILTGCSLSPTAAPGPAQGLAIRGKIHGGQSPIVGAHVYLFAAGTTGYGKPSSSLLDPALTGNSDTLGGYVLTDANGNFTLTGSYSCTPGTQVYAYALGGDPGTGANSASGLLAILGSCPAGGNLLASVPFVWMNEVTTIAAAYAFSGYATDATHVSSSGTPLATIGIANAFANATNLVNVANGTALSATAAGNGAVPQSEIDTLANIIATCVNSTGPGSTSCSSLLSNAMSSGTTGTVPSDTATAAIYLAHNPAAATATLFGLQPGIGAPFTPFLSTAPSDFSIALTFTTAGITASPSLAIDGQGNVWATDASNAVVELNSLGAPVSPAAGYTNPNLSSPSGIAIDTTGNAWVTNSGAVTTNLVQLSSTGTFMTSATTTNPGPFTSLALDPSGNIWLPAPTTQLLYKFSGAGNLLSSFPTPYNMDGIAIDHPGNVWTSNDGQNSLTEFDNTGTLVAGSPFITGIANPGHLAIDASSDVWALNALANAAVLTSAGSPVAGSPYNTSSTTAASAFALDGLGNSWIVTNTTSPTTYQVLGLSNSGSIISGTSGFTLSNSVHQVSAIALDGSGNIWLDTSNSLTELVGASAPVVTPAVSAVVNNTFATLP